MTVMTVKQLPIGEPLLRGYQFYAYPLAILAPHQEALPWIHSNFLQLCFYKDFRSGFPVPFAPYLYDYAANPWLKVQRIQRETLDVFQTSITTLLIESIQRGWYAYFNVNEFYIPRREAYQQQDHLHDILVFGYDEEQQTFDVLGFCNDMSFAATTVSFAEMEEAYRTAVRFDYLNKEICLYQFNESGRYAFDVRLVANLLEEYLLGRNTSEHAYMFGEVYDRANGMDAYPYLQDFLRAALDGDVFPDIRYMHILWEHKKCVLALIRFLEREGMLDPELGFSTAYLEVEQIVLTFRNAMHRYWFDQKAERLRAIVDRLDEVRTLEFEILDRLIKNLKKL
ncbi:MAG: hypothetical protein ACXVP5_00825 [Tumebacillaceae bacterium]